VCVCVWGDMRQLDGHMDGNVQYITEALRSKQWGGSDDHRTRRGLHGVLQASRRAYAAPSVQAFLHADRAGGAQSSAAAPAPAQGGAGPRCPCIRRRFAGSSSGHSASATGISFTAGLGGAGFLGMVSVITPSLTAARMPSVSTPSAGSVNARLKRP
jgi:hypothetical protein